MDYGYNYACNSPVNFGATASEYECQATCQASSTCVRFSYYLVNKLCILCNTLAGSKVSDSNYISGPPYCTGNTVQVHSEYSTFL